MALPTLSMILLVIMVVGCTAVKHSSTDLIQTDMHLTKFLQKSDGLANKNTRQKSSCDDYIFTMGRFIELVQKIESHPKIVDNSAKAVGSFLRYFMEADFAQDNFCHAPARELPDDILNESELQLLQEMLHYRQIEGNNKYYEQGVVMTDREETLALGHVITGITCGGYDRHAGEAYLSWLGLNPFHLNNVFLTTVSKVLSRTTISYHLDVMAALMGPFGKWDKLSCPKEFTMDGNKHAVFSDATDSTVLGALDGLLFAMVFPDIENLNLRFSTILLRYYGDEGLGPGNKFKDQNRIENFKMTVLDQSLHEQTVGYTKEYTRKEDVDRTLMRHLPETIREFYRQEYIEDCPASVREKFTIKYLIEIIESIEEASGYKLKEMTDSLLGLVEYFRSDYYDNIWEHLGTHSASDGYYWEIAYQLLGHRYVEKGRRELGVLQHGNRETLSASHVLAGISAGFERTFLEYETDMLYKSTVVGSITRSMLDARVLNSDMIIGDRGSWEYNCMARYMLNPALTTERASLAEVLGAMDGFIIGEKVQNMLVNNADLKLSDVLREYYSSGLGGDHALSYLDRVENFKHMSDGKNKLIQETVQTCLEFLEKDPRVRFRRVGVNECQSLSENAIDKLYLKVLAHRETDVDYGCFGDLMALNPTGASNQTGHQYNSSLLGVELSNSLIDEDIHGLETRRHCYEYTAWKNCLHPALVAALSSRESRAGHLVEDSSGWGDNNKAYGLLQCGRDHELDNCERYPWDSCEHVDMMMRDVFQKRMREVMQLQRDWPPHEQLQGGVAAFDFYSKHVKDFDKLDSGTTNNDYSNDVMSRAQWLITGHNWHYGPAEGSGRQAPDQKAQSKSQECLDEANKGDCDYYQCIGNWFDCGSDGHILGYSYTYCQRFKTFHDSFTEEGQQWADDSNKCMMNALLDEYKSPSTNCRNIKEIGLTLQPDCYAENGARFCEVVMDMTNWEALFNVFDLENSVNQSNVVALDVIRDTVGRCRSLLPDKMDDIKQTMQTVASRVRELTSWGNVEKEPLESGEDSECVTWANNGDCQFFECFDKAFPCTAFFPNTYINDFQLPHCRVLERNINKFDTSGQAWAKDSMTCLTQSLLAYYQSNDDVNCPDLHNFLFEKHLECYIGAGYCSMIDTNEWALQLSFNYLGYPMVTPDNDMWLSVYYYRDVAQLSRVIGDMNYECYARGLRQSKDIYETIYSHIVESQMNVKIPAH